MIVSVFYEDQRGHQVRDFGPHALLVQCLADRTGRSPNRIEGLVAAIPTKGNSKLLSQLSGPGHRALDRGPVYAVFDDDRVRDLVRLPPAACKSEVLAQVRRQAGADIDIVLLQANVETLVRACFDALNEPAPDSLHSHPVRDRILNRMAWTGSPDQRRRMLEACPSFERLVTRVQARLGSA